MSQKIRAVVLALVAASVLTNCGGGIKPVPSSTPSGGSSQPSTAPAVLMEISPAVITTHVPLGSMSLYGSGFASTGTVNVTGATAITGRIGSFSLTKVDFLADNSNMFSLSQGNYMLSVTNSGAAASNALPFRVYEPVLGPQLFRAQPAFDVAEGKSGEPAVADFDHDGFVDVAAVVEAFMAGPATGGLYLFHGRPDGMLVNPTKISAVTEQTPQSAHALDVNADGYDDLVVFSLGSFSVYLNDRSGGFTKLQTVTFAGPGYYAASADLDQDGHVDLIFTNNNGIIWVSRGQAGGTFATPTQLFANGTSPVVGDFNNDGKPDIAFSVLDPNTHSYSGRIAANQGGFNFTVSAPASIGTAISYLQPADLNGDGNVDLLVINDQPTLTYHVALGDGVGGFTAGPDISFSTSVAGPRSTATNCPAADFDGDGRLDYFLGNSFLWNDGNGSFQEMPVNGLGPSVAVGDVNGDGHPDVVTSSGQLVTAILGRSDRNFDSPMQTGPTPHGHFSVADLNGDHKPDVFVDGQSGPGTTLLNTGNGAMTVASASTPIGGRYIADLNNDGLADLIGIDTGGVTIWQGDGTGNFTGSPITISASTNDVAIRDMDGDGKLDLVVSGAVLFNQGSFQFTSVAVPNLTLPAAIVDVNGDGKLEIVVSGNVILNTGSRQFGGTASFSGTMPLASAFTTGDFNGDGKGDVAIAQNGFASSVAIYFGRADGSLRLGTVVYVPDEYSTPGESIAAADFDGDGRLDLAVGTYASYGAAVFRNNGDGTFQRSFLAAGTPPGQTAVADMNGDGKPDLIFQDIAGGIVVALHK